MMPPNRNSQYEKAFRRGKATSGAPIWIGSTRLANPNRIGVAYSSSMIVPCMVNSWLYCSLDKNCRPGAPSSERMSSAINPPAMKKPTEVTVYMMPNNFGSVVVTSRYTNDPLRPRRGGNGRVGLSSATALTVYPQQRGEGPSHAP